MSGPRSGLVAVLFTDLVGSTELMSQLGDRAYDELRRRHFASLGKAVAAHGGEEVKNTGDGLMAVFPSAAEAVEAAVAMQQATARQSRSQPVAIRVGLAVGDATAEGGDYFGTPVVEAARLVAAARPGQILATQIARALAGARCRAAFTQLGPLELKGLPEPVAVCDVGWQPTGSTVPMPALLTDVGRVFVGRDAELDRLTQLWKEAATGERRVALLAGEPGVGKTRLAAELANQVHEEGAIVLAGRCDEDLGVPYQPFVEALRHFVEHTPPDELVGGLGRYAGELTRLVPELAERVHALPPPLKSDPETERYRLFDALAAWLATASKDQPMVLVLDDLQWAAKPTLLLLRHVLGSSQPMRLLALGTYRDTELGHDHPLLEVVADLYRRGNVERLSLLGLDSAGVAAFMAEAAGHGLDKEGLVLARAIHEESEGNPFFVREILRHLAESGAVFESEGRWTYEGDVAALGIPESVREVVGRRIARLSDVANQALKVAAVMGAEFEMRVVQAASGLEPDPLLSSVEETLESRLIVEATGPSYRFAHALVRDALYGELSAARRVALHRRVAEAIEFVHAGRLDDHLPALAHHWARAGVTADETTRAVDYAIRAGDRALAQLAHDEAVAYYGQALELLDTGGVPIDHMQRLDLIISLGEAQRRAGQGVFRRTLLDAADAARQLGDTERLVRAVLANNRGTFSAAGEVDYERVEALEAAAAALGPDDSTARAQVLATLGTELTFAKDWERRRNLTDEALAIARRVGDDATLARVLNLRGQTIQVPETVNERLANTAENLVVTARLGDPFQRYFALWLHRQAAFEAADIQQADRALEDLERLAVGLGQPALRWYGMNQRVCGEALAGRIDDAERLAADALQLGYETEGPEALAIYTFQLVMLRLDQSRLDELEPMLAQVVATNPGLPVLRALLALIYCDLDRRGDAERVFAVDAANGFTDVPYDLAWGTCLAAHAQVCSYLEHKRAAADLFEKLRPASGLLTYAVVFTIGAIDHYLGLLARTLDRLEEAERYFAAAEVTHERIGAPAWLARSRLEWARMLLTRHAPGDPDRSRELLGQALDTARELGLANVERRAVELLQ